MLRDQSVDPKWRMPMDSGILYKESVQAHATASRMCETQSYPVCRRSAQLQRRGASG